ncbi:hypothetical protein [Agrococcus sp. TSP3-2-1]|uniref:hypothetical protein n=1 Tax=Agrococcus sp. TSP3-2-1 TaxID=2804583 RepID=UPI003CFAF57E
MLLVLIHGRQQQGLNAEEEKAKWLRALHDGMDAIGVSMPLREDDVRFAYYGDALDRLQHGRPGVEVIIRGEASVEELEAAFSAPLLEQWADSLSHGAFSSEVRDESLERNVLGHPRVRRVLQWLNDNWSIAGAASLYWLTRDVYLYLNSARVQRAIDQGVEAALARTEPMVVVGHSLGSVVAHSVVSRLQPADGWQVPLLVTLGSPLAIRAVRESLASPVYPPVVSEWLNAFDARDVVALHPLTQQTFPTDRVIHNHDGVDNASADHHAVDKYLEDPGVARWLHDALEGLEPPDRPLAP